MDLLKMLDTAGSALTAQRLRMDVISSNLANIQTTTTPQGGPYRREMVVFRPRPSSARAPFDRTGFGFSFGRNVVDAPTTGVEVAAVVPDASPLRRVHEPGNPLADQNGFVAYPNVDLSTEMVDLMAASRAYEANTVVLQTAKQLAERTLQMGQA